MILIDEVLTPDSSRFWPQDGYRPGGAQPSFDKQFVRDYLESIELEQAAARARRCRAEVIEKTREKYVESVPPPHRQGALSRSMISDRLDKLVDEMVERGVQFDDAIHEFEKRFIARVLAAATAA